MKIVTSRFGENFEMAWDTLRGNKLRSGLTILGVVVGVITVMLISSIISGIEVAVEEQVKSFGTRSVFIYKMPIGPRTSRPSSEERQRPNLTYDDAMALRGLSEIETAVPQLDVSSGPFGGDTIVSAKGVQSASISLKGTLPEIEVAGTEELVDGRWFTQEENNARKDVCVIGDSVKKASFRPIPHLVKILTLRGACLRSLGFWRKRSNFLAAKVDPGIKATRSTCHSSQHGV